jgi:hypothetical protein
MPGSTRFVAIAWVANFSRFVHCACAATPLRLLPGRSRVKVEQRKAPERCSLASGNACLTPLSACNIPIKMGR